MLVARMAQVEPAHGERAHRHGDGGEIDRERDDAGRRRTVGKPRAVRADALDPEKGGGEAELQRPGDACTGEAEQQRCEADAASVGGRMADVEAGAGRVRHGPPHAMK